MPDQAAAERVFNALAEAGEENRSTHYFGKGTIGEMQKVAAQFSAMQAAPRLVTNE